MPDSYATSPNKERTKITAINSTGINPSFRDYDTLAPKW